MSELDQPKSIRALRRERKLKFKLREGRHRDSDICYSVMRDSPADVYTHLKEKVSLDELSELIYLFFDKMKECVVSEKLGVELPLNMGYIQVSGIKETAYKVGKAPSTLKKAVVNPNYHTDGHVFESWYRFTNSDNIVKNRVGVFFNAWAYRFKSSRQLRVCINTAIKEGKWKIWGRFNSRNELYSSVKNSSNITFKD